MGSLRIDPLRSVQLLLPVEDVAMFQAVFDEAGVRIDWLLHMGSREQADVD